MDIKCSDTFNFVVKEIESVRAFVGKREYVDDGAATGVLSGFVNKVCFDEIEMLQPVGECVSVDNESGVERYAVFVENGLGRYALDDAFGRGYDDEGLF